MPSAMSIEIATKVIAKAKIVDTRFRVGATDEAQAAQIMGWAEIFDGQPVWLTEALDAVLDHYRKRNAFPIMPGDVIAYCEQQPATSSPEHVAWIINLHIKHPWSSRIQELVGREIPELDPMSYDNRDKEFLIGKRREWIASNGNALVAEAIENAERKAIGR